jgi:ribonuclease BN (tRNA processing enzyme)
VNGAPGQLELVVLGAGPAYTDRTGATGAAYLVRLGDAAILLDLGQGSFTRLAEEIEPSRLEAVVVSHLHPDHFIDLVPLRHYLRWEFGPGRRVRVLAPAGLEERLDALHAEPGFAGAALDIERLEEGRLAIGPFNLETRLVTHTAESYAFRLTAGDGPGLVYSGDCGRASDLDSLVRPEDTLLVEAYFGVGPVAPGAEHLDAEAVAALGERAHPGRILVTHIRMGADRSAIGALIEDRVGVPVDLVDPGDRFRLA